MRFLFILQTLFGLLMILGGIVASARPYLLLDVVLTEAELRDQNKHDETLALLQKAVGPDDWVLILGGLGATALGVLGFIKLHSSAERPETNDAQRPN